MLKKLSNYNNLAKILLISSSFILFSCSSLDVVPYKTDWYEEGMVSKGNDTLEIDSIPITERLAKMLGSESNINIKNGITFELALNQFSVMPLLSVDRAAGVIVTDWYSSSSNINERVKFNIIIKDEMMEYESIKINMFKETFDGTNWRRSQVNDETTNKIKQLILDKAKRLQATAELS